MQAFFLLFTKLINKKNETMNSRWQVGACITRLSGRKLELSPERRLFAIPKNVWKKRIWNRPSSSLKIFACASSRDADARIHALFARMQRDFVAAKLAEAMCGSGKRETKMNWQTYDEKEKERPRIHGNGDEGEGEQGERKHARAEEGEGERALNPDARWRTKH